MSANLIRHSEPGGRSVSRKAVRLLVHYPDEPNDHWAFTGIAPAMVNAARTVMRDRPDTIEAILHGATTLANVFEEIQQDGAKLAREKEVLAQLWASSPLIADMVSEGREGLDMEVGLQAGRRLRGAVEAEPGPDPARAPTVPPRRRRRR